MWHIRVHMGHVAFLPVIGKDCQSYGSREEANSPQCTHNNILGGFRWRERQTVSDYHNVITAKAACIATALKLKKKHPGDT